jgi:hypothetical protein
VAVRPHHVNQRVAREPCLASIVEAALLEQPLDYHHQRPQRRQRLLLPLHEIDSKHSVAHSEADVRG